MHVQTANAIEAKEKEEKRKKRLKKSSRLPEEVELGHILVLITNGRQIRTMNLMLSYGWKEKGKT